MLSPSSNQESLSTDSIASPVKRMMTLMIVRIPIKWLSDPISGSLSMFSLLWTDTLKVMSLAFRLWHQRLFWVFSDEHREGNHSSLSLSFNLSSAKRSGNEELYLETNRDEKTDFLIQLLCILEVNQLTLLWAYKLSSRRSDLDSGCRRRNDDCREAVVTKMFLISLNCSLWDTRLSSFVLSLTLKE